MSIEEEIRDLFTFGEDGRLYGNRASGFSEGTIKFLATEADIAEYVRGKLRALGEDLKAESHCSSCGLYVRNNCDCPYRTPRAVYVDKIDAAVARACGEEKKLTLET